MKTITYIEPSKKQFLANVKYNSGEEKTFEYVVGGYKKEKYVTTLVNIDNEDMVDILDDAYSKIIFLKPKTEVI